MLRYMKKNSGRINGSLNSCISSGTEPLNADASIAQHSTSRRELKDASDILNLCTINAERAVVMVVVIMNNDPAQYARS